VHTTVTTTWELFLPQLANLFGLCHLCRVTQQMLDHPSAQHLSSDDVEQLLLTALVGGHDASAALMCQHAIALKLSPSAIGRLLAATVQLLSSSASALQSALSLLHLGTVSMEHLVPAIRTAVCFSDTRSLQTICNSMHLMMPNVASYRALPEALRSVVLLRDPHFSQEVKSICSRLGCGQHVAQEQVAAVAGYALLSGSHEAMRCAPSFPTSSSVTIWQPLLAKALFVQDQEAAQMLAGKCHQQRLHEPLLPGLLHAAPYASAYGRAGHAGERHVEVGSSTQLCSTDEGSRAAWPVVPLQ
jgi:hypothetical protein